MTFPDRFGQPLRALAAAPVRALLSGMLATPNGVDLRDARSQVPVRIENGAWKLVR